MRIFLAPMEGVVDHHMRYILSKFSGIDFCVTEFIRVTNHTLPRRVFTKYCPELIVGAEKVELTEVPTRIQLLGSNPEVLASNARKAASLGAPGVDLNFGCPAKTVNRNRGGACLLNETELIYEIVSRVRDAVPSEIPVTAKIRLGYEDRDSYLENALAIEKAGASELFVHARSKTDGYKPPAYWSCIGEINRAVNIPVIANGEIWSVDDFARCKNQSQSQDFMLGRGLLARPDLAAQIKNHMLNTNLAPLDWQQVCERVHEFFILNSECYESKHMGNRVKQWLHYLQRNYAQAQVLFEKIKRLRDFDEINRHIMDSLEAKL